MKLHKHILFPSDFSANAGNALMYAGDLARRTGSGLHLLHVYDLPLTAPSSIFTTRDEAMKVAEERIRETVRSHLERAVKDNGFSGLSCKYIITNGNARNEIAGYAEKNRTSMIVMGTRGAGGLQGALMGSVTASVMRLVRCPVLAVPENAAFRPFHNMVYATELACDETHIFEKMVALARHYDASLTFLHINDDTQKPAGSEALRKFIEKNSYGRLAFSEILARDIATAIESYIRDHGKDLIAMTSHSQNLLECLFHRSLTRHELLHTRIPMLAFSVRKYDWLFL